MVTQEFTLILTPNGSKKALPPRKTPQHKNKSFFPQKVIFQKLKYICIISMHRWASITLNVSIRYFYWSKFRNEPVR